MSSPVKSHLDVLLIADCELHTGRVVTNRHNLVSEKEFLKVNSDKGLPHLVCVALFTLFCDEVDVYFPGHQASSILILYLQLQHCHLGEEQKLSPIESSSFLVLWLVQTGRMHIQSPIMIL